MVSMFRRRATRARHLSLSLTLALAALPPALQARALDELVPAAAHRLTAAGTTGRLGSAVADVGDVNGDGYRDVLIGAPSKARGATAAVGAAYLVFGTSVGLPTLDMANLSPGVGCAIGSGTAAASASIGIAVAGVGDFDGDGLADVAIGSRIGDFNTAAPGKVWIVYGRSTFPAALDLDTDARTTTVVGAENADGFGTALAGGGSINGDARPDLAIGAPYGHGLNGGVYVVFGRTLPPASINVGSLNGTTGISIVDDDFLDLAGFSVALGGDANGDGVGDLLIGAFGLADAQAHSVGGAYWVKGSANGFTGTSTLSLTDVDGTIGARFVGKYYAQSQADAAGSAVAFLPDMNGDGRDELVIADPDASPRSRAFSGEVFVRMGQASYSASETLGATGSTIGFSLQGARGGDKFGTDLSTSSDFNGDGRADLLVSAPQVTDSTPLGTGKVALIYGRGAFPAAVDLLPLETRGFNGELFTGPTGTTDTGRVAALCARLCTGGPRLAVGVSTESSNDGAVYVVSALDRIFYDDVEGN